MNARSVAYFSMEIALDAALPTYSGGLGVSSSSEKSAVEQPPAVYSSVNASGATRAAFVHSKSERSSADG